MPSKRTIAFVANTSWSIYKFRLHLIKDLLRNGYPIYVLAPEDEYTSRFSDLPGLVFIPLTKFEHRNVSIKKDLRLYAELLNLYRRIRPDLIFHYTIKANIFGSLAAAKAGITSVSVITGLGHAFTTSWMLKTTAKVLYRYSLRKNTENWFLNPDDEAFFIHHRMARKGKTFLLPGEGIDTDLFYPVPYVEAGITGSPIAEKPVVFLLIARLIRNKGITEFAEAASILQQKGLNAAFQLLGFFDEKNPVSISRQQLLRWTVKKWISYLGETDNVVPFISRADCIVLPSYSGEGIPLSLLEGASMAKALIVSNEPGCRELVEDTVNGYLCRKKDASDLAEKMEKYYHLSAEDKKQMGLAGREKVRNRFRQEIISEIYLDKIKAILD